ncbi:MAG: hypothetical protein JW757_10505 [Anaerolineales bacterium]|nr:hypothetical protein [Anaerolineales bacterium]
MRSFGRLLGIIAQPLGSFRGISWLQVSEPTGWLWSLPFTIEQRGRQFRAKDFNLQARAGISVTKTYYVDADNGDDGNSGADWDNAFATLGAAESAGDADRVYLKGFFHKSAGYSGLSRSMELIGVDNPTLSSSQTDNLGSWTGVDNYYWSQSAHTYDYVANVIDYNNLDAFGDPQHLTPKASIAEVDAAANSFYYDTATDRLYIRTFDDREPDADIAALDSLCAAWQKDSLTYYVEGVTFLGGVRIRNNSASGGLKAYFKNCDFSGGGQVTIAGVDEIMFQGCSVHNYRGDGLNYDDLNGITTKAVEIDCEIYNLGTETNHQASTTHNETDIVRINGKYHHTYGQCISDGGDQTWMLGCELYNSLVTDVGFNLSDDTAWLDSVTIHDVGTDLQNVAGTTIYTRDLVSGGSNTINGTLSTY